MSHTPGPWEVRQYGSELYVVTPQHDDGRFTGHVIASRTTCPDWKDNAHLIAAAPDLLEALCELLPTAENWACCCEINGDGVNNPAAVTCRHARAAIAKAKGKP